MKKTNIKKIFMKLILILLGIYAFFTIVNQQQTLNQYSKNKQEVTSQIQEQKEYKEELTAKKDDVNSLEFIEQTAREKLDMYLPNEKVYIDQGM